MFNRLRCAVKFRFSLALALIAACSCGKATAQTIPQILQTQINQQKHLAAAWEDSANLEFGLGLLVVALGAAVVLLQKFDGKKWCSHAVAFIGILISTLTFATKEYFDVDHKTYRKNAEAVKREILNAETYLLMVNSPDIDPDSRQEFLVQVTRSIAKVSSIADGIGGKPSIATGSNNGARLELIGAAIAQPSSRPDWLSQRRTENTTSYRFVGAGSASSAAAAKTQALFEAQNAAASSLSVPLDTIRRYHVIVDTYFEYNSAQRLYRCYARIELNRAFVRR